MSLITKLISIEWLKLRHRSVFWVSIIAHTTILAIGLAVRQYMHAQKPNSGRFDLPADWADLIGSGAGIGMLMLLICVASVTASEVTWRTQRQNVIDGLSRAQYFLGKILVAVLVAFVIWALIIIVGLIAAPFGGAGALSWPLLESPAPLMLINMMLYLVALGMTGFMFGMLASSSGAAVTLILAFIIIQPILSSYMASEGGTLAKMSQYLPNDVFSNLVNRTYYDEAARAQVTAMIEKMGGMPPITLSLSVIMTIVYTFAFVGITWMIFRERDL